MIKTVLISIMVLICVSVRCQGDVIDIRVVKNNGIDILPDTPYLIHFHKYQFAITGTHAGDEISVSIDKGKATVKDTTLYLIPIYTKGERHTEPDTAVVTVTLRDKHQAAKGSFRKQYMVCDPLGKPQMASRESRITFWGDWPIGTYDVNDKGTDTPAYRRHILENLDKEFTSSDLMSADTARFRFSSLTLTILTHYRQFHTGGNRLTGEMINAIREEKDGCEFMIQLFKKNEVPFSTTHFDTRPFNARKK